MRLTTTECRNAQPLEKRYRMTDGHGLSLMVYPTGNKVWQFGYRFNGEPKTLVIGNFPAYGVAEARKALWDARKRLDVGIDPQAEAGIPITGKTFAEACWEHFDIWKIDKVSTHVERIWSRLEQDALPELGDRQLTDIKPADVVTVIRKVEDRGAMDVSRRLRQKISEVFGYAIAMGYCDADPASRVGVVLKPRPKVEHMPKVDAKDVPALLRAIDGYGDEVVRLALLWTLLTAARTNETREARWSEIVDGVWRIPGSRMKMGRDHLVPLSKQAIEVLGSLKKHRRGEYLFPGPRRPTINSNAMIYGLYDLGWRGKQTVHGFRGLFSTTLNEAGFNRDWIEVSLAHSDDSVRGAYNAALYLEQRATLLQWWADRLDQWRIDGMLE